METGDRRTYPRGMEYGHTEDYGVLTVREYALLPDEAYGDLVRGRLVREPLPKPWHGMIEVALARALHEWVQPRALGIVLTECGFLLRDEPPTVRGPDVAFVAAGRLPRGGMANEYWPGAPDLAVEVLSRSTRAITADKVEDYLATGSRLVWVVDPQARTLIVHEPDRPTRTLRGTALLYGEPVLPGFLLPVDQLFADLPSV